MTKEELERFKKPIYNMDWVKKWFRVLKMRRNVIWQKKINKRNSIKYIAQLTRNNTENEYEKELLNYMLGLNGKCGKLTDIIRKWMFDKKQLNMADIVYELGDMLFYLTNIAALFGFSLTEIQLNNNVKLLNKYKENFSDEE